MFEILFLRFVDGFGVGRSKWKVGYIVLFFYVVGRRVNEGALVVR